MTGTPRKLAVCVALLLSGVAEGRERLAVFDLAPEKFDREVAQQLSEQLRREFRRLDHLELVERADLYAYLVGKGLNSTACDRPCLVAVGRGLGVRWIIAGDIMAAGDQVRLQAMLYDPVAERVSKQVDRKVSADVQRLREREMEKLARELSPPQKGGGFQWLLLLLGAGGGGAWWALQDGGGPSDDGAGPGDGYQDGELGAADVIGTISD